MQAVQKEVNSVGVPMWGVHILLCACSEEEGEEGGGRRRKEEDEGGRRRKEKKKKDCRTEEMPRKKQMCKIMWLQEDREQETSCLSSLWVLGEVPLPKYEMTTSCCPEWVSLPASERPLTRTLLLCVLIALCPSSSIAPAPAGRLLVSLPGSPTELHVSGPQHVAWLTEYARKQVFVE